jgi:hypothetical protein
MPVGICCLCPYYYKTRRDIMPGRDGTGPAGAGSMTGRRAGYCNGNEMPGFMGGSLGFGMCVRGSRRRGRIGFGSGWGNPGVDATVTLSGRRGVLEERIQVLQNEISEIKKRLGSMRK